MVTSDLGRVTTSNQAFLADSDNCGDVRSRTSYNVAHHDNPSVLKIVVTSDLGRVTTALEKPFNRASCIVVTSDLGRVTTLLRGFKLLLCNCGDVRSRTSYNLLTKELPVISPDCGDVRSRTSYNLSSTLPLRSGLDCGDVRSRTSYNEV